MTTTSEVLLVVPDAWLRASDDPEDLQQVDRFATELASDGLVTPRVAAIGTLSGDPDVAREDTLFVVFDELGAVPSIATAIGQQVEAIERRTFAASVHRRRETIEALERSNGPGCIEAKRLFVWQTELPEDDPPGGVFGRKDVAHEIGARWVSTTWWESEHYAMLFHNDYPTLPRLLAAYLAGFRAVTGTYD